MDFFVTGASGYIGGAVTCALVMRGHRVRGLARSPAAAARVRASGGVPIEGSLLDTELLAQEAGGGDGVVHTAASEGPERERVDRAAVDAMLAAMSGGAFITTTGAPCTRASRKPVAEQERAELPPALAWLAEAEARVLESGRARGVVVRPPIVYGDGRGPLAHLVERARGEGEARYIGDGRQCWSVVHVRDLAVAYAMLAERPVVGAFHAAEAAPISMARLFTAIAEAAGVPVRAWPLEQALAAHGPLAAFLARDAALDATKLRALGWTPRFGEALGGPCGALAPVAS